MSNLTKYFFSLLLFWVGGLAVSAQEDDYEVSDMVDEEEYSADGEIVILDDDEHANWTPEQRWIHSLCSRLDSVLQRDRIAKKTVRRGKGKKARRVTTTVKRNYRVGINVFDLTTDSTIYSHNDHDMFIPASNQKLFVSITALSTIGADHNFFTDIYTDGEEQIDRLIRYQVQSDSQESGNDTPYDTIGVDTIDRYFLKGNVYVRGGFDPTLGKDDVDFVAGKLMALGVDSIDGKVYGYEPQKSQVSGSWFWEKHPSRVFPSLLHNAMTENGIAFSSDKAYGSISSPMELKGTWVTSLNTPLVETLKRMMKNSDNYYAESMLLNLCDLRNEETWSYEQCKQQVRDMIKRAGGLESEYAIYDGSGLSHSNKTTPALLSTILRYAYHNKEIFDPLYESLPIAGVDGTIGSRMRGTPAYNNVRAKTGTVNGVSTLSGYVTAPNGHFLAFSILVNNVSSSSVGRHLQDLLCIEMAR